MAVTARTRRKPASGELEQLRGELVEARAEIGELRQALRAVAGLAFGIGIHRAPIQVGRVSNINNIADICRLYGVSGHAATIEKLFSP